MFSKSSRYRKLAESSVLTAQGEQLHGLELRPLPLRTGSFQHLVREGERLDLLSFQYYGDPAKWWQVADANPASTFPPALLDSRPLLQETLKLSEQSTPETPILAVRYQELRDVLSSLGQVSAQGTSFFQGETEAPQPSFLAATVTVSYPTSSATRQQIIAAINERFRFLSSFAWAQDNQTAEAFTFDDPQYKARWQALLTRLRSQAGVLAVRSQFAQARLELVWHSGLLSRVEITDLIVAQGFTVNAPLAAQSSQAGTHLIIPPNQLA